MKTIDLNCDMGESFGLWHIGQDTDVIPHITTANVACGAHAGDPNVMLSTVRLAKQHGVAVGAHPGFPDLQGFGRRPMRLSPEEIEATVLYQIGALWAIARSEGVKLSHVKPHGALYNMAASDSKMATAIARAVSRFSRELLFYCLPGSESEASAVEHGLTVMREGFVDRAYEPNGSLVDRSIPGAVPQDPSLAAHQALELADGRVRCRDGSLLELRVETLCLHGDTPGAPQIAQAVRSALVQSGYQVKAPAYGR
jgi:5-oxoprolinase (ATP-hydrolysing) subunit A